MFEGRIKTMIEMTGLSELEVIENMIKDRDNEIRELKRYYQIKLERESA